MLAEILGYLNNYFECLVFRGTYTISDGALPPSFELQDGQYFRIVGSVFNDGVYRHPCIDLTVETFTGEVWVLAVPPDVSELAAAIADWNAKAENTSHYTSESFGGYSYSRATDEHGAPATWQTVFAPRLRRWRKI